MPLCKNCANLALHSRNAHAAGRPKNARWAHAVFAARSHHSRNFSKAWAQSQTTAPQMMARSRRAPKLHAAHLQQCGQFPGRGFPGKKAYAWVPNDLFTTNMFVLPVLFYGPKCWSMTAAGPQVVRVLRHNCVRRICKVPRRSPWKQRITAAELFPDVRMFEPSPAGRHYTKFRLFNSAYFSRCPLLLGDGLVVPFTGRF